MASLLCGDLLGAEEPTHTVGSAYYRHWLESVDLLATKREKELFHELSDDTHREEFIHRFWLARAGGRPNTARLLWARRAEEARRSFGRLDDDRARITLLHGPASYRVQFGNDDPLEPCGVFRPMEILYYSATEDRGRFYALFAPRHRGGSSYRLWHRDEGIDPLLPWSRSTAHEELLRRPLGEAIRAALQEAEERGCFHRRASLKGIVAAAAGGDTAGPDPEHRPFPDADPSWTDRFRDELRRVPLLPPSPATLAVSRFDDGSGTVIDVASSIPAAAVRELSPTRAGYRRVAISLEVLHENRVLAEYWQQHWLAEEDLPAGGDVSLHVTGRLPAIPADQMVLLLRVFPGEERSLRSVRRLQDAASIAREVRPFSPDPAGVLDVDTVVLERWAIPQAGISRIRARVLGREIVAVRFVVPGQESRTARSAPFETELDLGGGLHSHRVEAIGLDSAGREVSRDSAVYRAGPQGFRVRLRELGDTAQGDTLVEAVIEAPISGVVERAEFSIGDERLAALLQEPWILRVAGARRQPVVVRCVVTLRDGRTAEGTTLVGGSGIFESVQVRLVELYLSAEDTDGRAIVDLRPNDLVVLEDGRPQTTVDLEPVESVPLLLGVLADASDTMREELELERRAALELFRQVLRKGDLASFLLFDQDLEIVVPPTGDVDWLADGTTALRAGGGTALHDSLVFSLNYLAQPGRRSAVVLLSDGMDEGSVYDAESVLESVRRTGAVVYPILLEGSRLQRQMFDSMRNDREYLARGRARRLLRRLARESGGLFQELTRDTQLERVLERIAADLGGQYRLSYQSPYTDAGGAFRAVEVVTRREGVEIRTAGGYYAD